MRQCHRPAQQCSASAGPTALPSTSTHGQRGKLSKSDTTGRFFCLGTSNTREEPNSQRPSEQAKAHTIQLSRTASSCYSTFPLPTFSTQPLTFCPFPPCCLLYSFSFLCYQLLLMGPLLLSSSRPQPLEVLYLFSRSSSLTLRPCFASPPPCTCLHSSFYLWPRSFFIRCCSCAF